MYFRNLKAYRLDDAWRYTADELNALLAAAAFVPCSKSAMRSTGWVPPRGNPEEYVVTVAGQQLIALCIETKLLPANVVRQHVQARCEKLEAAQGYKPGRGQQREIREQVTAELVPRAFPQRSIVHVWIDTNGRWLVVDAGSHSKADDVVEQIKRALDALPLLPLRTALSPATAMTQWLAAGEAPAGLTIDRDCELRSLAEEKSTVRYSRHLLEGEETRHHLEAGKRCTRLALTWNDRISFVFGEDLCIKRLAFLDLLKEQAEQISHIDDKAVDCFEADFAIMSGELSKLLDAVVEALGGEAEQ